MMMVIFGDAVILSLGGITFISNHILGMVVLLLCMFYLLGVSIFVLKLKR
jgi:hypothetical protein